MQQLLTWGRTARWSAILDTYCGLEDASAAPGPSCARQASRLGRQMPVITGEPELVAVAHSRFWHGSEGSRRRNIFASHVGCNRRGYETPTAGKMTPHHRTTKSSAVTDMATETIDVAVQDPPRGDRRVNPTRCSTSPSSTVVISPNRPPEAITLAKATSPKGSEP